MSVTADSHLLPTATTGASWRQLRGAFHGLRLEIVAMLALTVIGAVAGLLGPFLLGRIIDIITDASSSRLSTVIALLIAVAVVQAAAVSIGGVLLTRIGGVGLARVREQVVDRVVQLPTGDIERAGSGDVVARLSGDVEVVSDTLATVLHAVLGSVITIATTIVGLAVLDWRFAIAGALAMPIQLHTLRWYLRVSNPLYASERRAEGARSQAMLDTLGALDTVRAYGLGDHQIERVATASSHARDLSLAATRLRSRFFARLNLAEVIGLGSILVVGFVLARDDAATVGACTAAALYFHRLFDPINIVLASVDSLQAASAALARLLGLATIAIDDPPTPNPATAPFALELSGVDYRYGDTGFELHDIDLAIETGQTVAFVGGSGAGKTTLARIVAGQLQERAGDVRRTGSVAMVTQDIHVFTGTIAEDLRLAAPNASDQTLRDALERVGALGWVDALDEGLATVVGEGGHALDGHMAQQLALARVLLADPDIVVLDEATAEAGSAGAATLDAAARAVVADRTAIVVAHRLSQARLADVIMVFDNGRIVERGSHDQLVARGGGYAALWSAWGEHRASGR